MRERRKKKRMYEKKQQQQQQEPENENVTIEEEEDNDKLSSTLPNGSNPGISSTRKRPHTSNGISNKNDSNNNKIIIPAHLSAKEAKKFRKDERRKARAQGLDDSKLIFVLENGDDDDDDDTVKEKPLKKRQKTKDSSHFPNLNQLVQEQRRQQEQTQAEAARLQAEGAMSVEEKGRYVALDCEMVGVGSSGKQSALARASLVDWDGNVLLDSFVQVPTKVTDFRTQWSGVLPKHLQSRKAMTVDACRKQVTELLRDKILVGHALSNDLKALMLTHPAEHIRDTAKYRPYQRCGGDGKWRPRKLRDLVAENVQGMTIQRPGESHDSVDDARAAMEVFKRARVAWEAALERKQKKKHSKKD